MKYFKRTWEESRGDEHGGLSDQKLDLKEFNEYLIEKIEFENIWT